MRLDIENEGDDTIFLNRFVSLIFSREGLGMVIARPFPRIGPGQSEQFFCSNWTRQIAAIEAGKKPPVIGVENLEIVTGYCDVRDVAKAFIRRWSDRGSGGSRLTITLSSE